ncbi:hypothetical protein GF342_00610 [Candidatus Woesearchaeota archaeon]|nr:hypothetical protein [Candidatus Woesearchaeota archaeon]
MQAVLEATKEVNYEQFPRSNRVDARRVVRTLYSLLDQRDPSDPIERRSRAGMFFLGTSLLLELRGSDKKDKLHEVVEDMRFHQRFLCDRYEGASFQTQQKTIGALHCQTHRFLEYLCE